MSKSPTEAERTVLDYLKGEGNPFESLVRPQRLDEDFAELHIPELLKGERETVLNLIDRYRIQEFQRATDMPSSRVVFVLGDRGAGKTHLLRSLHFDEGGKSHLILQPEFYQKDLNIEEYLLSQVVLGLLADDEVHHGKPIDDLAAVFTRRLLRQALLAATPTDRMFLSSPGPWERWWFLWGGGNQWHARAEDLADKLQGAQAGPSFSDLVSQHGFSAPAAFRLVQGHLQRCEKGRDLVASFRRQLYANMARLALLNDRGSLERFLGGEYEQTEGVLGSRFDMTGRLLQVLLEVCALVRMPVVFAFDNLERFFSPTSQFDGALTRAFFNNLAQAVDSTRGMLFLVFAEKGLYQSSIVPNLDEFARVRLDQGVPLPGKGPTFEVHLPPSPTPQAMHAFVTARMARVLRDAPPHAELSELFPFSAQELDSEIIGEGKSLRNILRRLRDLYSQIVYRAGIADSAAPPAPPPPPPPLELLWQQHRRSAEQRLVGSLVPHLKDLQAGLGGILQKAQPLTLGGYTLHEVQPAVAVGENANYGVATILSWTKDAENGSAEPLRIAVGLLLAGGMGMAADLKSKFDVFRARSLRVDRLFVLWYTGKEADDLVSALPPRTRKVWDENKRRARTELRFLDREDLWTLAAFHGWTNTVQEQTDEASAPALIRNFANQHFHGIFDCVAVSASPVTEGSLYDED